MTTENIYKAMEKILIGADPELFVFDKIRNHFISAHDLIPGTKEEPHKIRSGAIQVDGMAAEFNIKPSLTLEEFLESINKVTSYLKSKIKIKNGAYDVRAVPTATFPPQYFYGDVPYEAKELGCHPDYNAYTLDANPRPETDEPFRTGSGHIHVGWGTNFNIEDPNFFELCSIVVKQLDASLYPISLLWDDDQKRRQLYGQMGAFRPKPYGVEYRVLSNKWVDDRKLCAWIFHSTKRAMTLLSRGIHLYKDKGYVSSYIDSKTIPNWETNMAYYSKLRLLQFPKLPKRYTDG